MIDVRTTFHLIEHFDLFLNLDIMWSLLLLTNAAAFSLPLPPYPIQSLEPASD